MNYTTIFCIVLAISVSLLTVEATSKQCGTSEKTCNWLFGLKVSCCNSHEHCENWIGCVPHCGNGQFCPQDGDSNDPTSDYSCCSGDTECKQNPSTGLYRCENKCEGEISCFINGTLSPQSQNRFVCCNEEREECCSLGSSGFKCNANYGNCIPKCDSEAQRCLDHSGKAICCGGNTVCVNGNKCEQCHNPCHSSHGRTSVAKCCSDNEECVHGQCKQCDHPCSDSHTGEIVECCAEGEICTVTGHCMSTTGGC